MLYILLIHLFALITPGPDFVYIARTSIVFKSKKVIINAVLGVTIGVSIWILLTIIGLNKVFVSYPVLQPILAIIGSFYLIYLSYQIYISYKLDNSDFSLEKNEIRNVLLNGIFTSLSNPKAVIYFASVFSMFLKPSYNTSTYLIICCSLILETFLWFLFVSKIFSSNILKKIYSYNIKKIEISSAIIFFAFGIIIFIKSIYIFL